MKYVIWFVLVTVFYAHAMIKYSRELRAHPKKAEQAILKDRLLMTAHSIAFVCALVGGVRLLSSMG